MSIPDAIDKEKHARMEARVAKLRADRENPLTLLHAVQRNELRYLEVVHINDINRNGEDELGVTPLVEAVINKNYEITKYLLNQRVNPNHITKMGYTALSLLLYNIVSDDKYSIIDIRLILLLLRYGANPTLQTTHKTAAEYLEEMGYEISGIYLRRRVLRTISVTKNTL